MQINIKLSKGSDLCGECGDFRAGGSVTVMAEVEDDADGADGVESVVSKGSNGKAGDTWDVERRGLSVFREMLAAHHTGAKLQVFVKNYEDQLFCPYHF